MSTKRTVGCAALGLCEHCGALLCLEDMPSDALDAEWRCQGCKGVLNGGSFGYQTIDGKPKRVKWVGPGKKWVEQPPAQDFDLGNLYVIVGYGRMTPF